MSTSTNTTIWAGRTWNTLARADFQSVCCLKKQTVCRATGFLSQDFNRGISKIQYNLLNLPQVVDIKSPVAEARNTYSYSADGVKLRVVQRYNSNFNSAPVIGSDINLSNLDKVKTTDYVGNKVFENGALKRILVDGGYIEGGIYYFYLTDHLGNNRVVVNQSGSNVQNTDYYPYGESMAHSTGDGAQPYKYGGKEYDAMHGLNLSDFSARMKSDWGFTTVDPLAEDYFEVSPYAFCDNNPLRYLDPSGMSLTDTVIVLPAVVVTQKESDIIGTRAADPIYGFWGLFHSFFGERTYSQIATWGGGGVATINYSVNSNGIITGKIPMMGTPPDVGFAPKGVLSYLKLKSLVKLSGIKGLEVHHLVEVRHLRRLFMSTGKTPSVVLTKVEHNTLTQKLRKLLPYGTRYEKEEIIEAYKKVYADKPEWLNAALDYLQH